MPKGTIGSSDYWGMISRLDAFIKRNDSLNPDYSKWFVGISSSNVFATIKAHNALLTPNGIMQCANDGLARSLQAAFIQMGCQAHPASNCPNGEFVYVYRITPNTKQIV